VRKRVQKKSILVISKNNPQSDQSSNTTQINGSLKDSTTIALKQYFKMLNGHTPCDLYKLVIEEVELPLIETVMEHAKQNQTQAAAILGINRSTLRKKLKTFDLIK
jgi:Fis family transcriptional regulator